MAKTYDAIFKRIIDDFSPDWGAWSARRCGLPSGPLTVLDPDLSTVQAQPDKVFRLPDGAGLLHLEIQSSWDGELNDRMLFYNVLLNHRHGGPVHSTTILLRPEANASNITGTVTRLHANGREYHRFMYDVVKVWELAADELLSGGLGTAPLALLTNDAKDRIPELVQSLSDRVRREIAGTGRKESFLTGCYLLLGLRYDEEIIHPLFQRIDYMRESTTYQAILQEGRVEGRVEGRAETSRAILVAILERKFGAIPAALESRVKGCTDLAKLEEAAIQAATSSDLVEYERDVQL